jgi:hypothetical protein
MVMTNISRYTLLVLWASSAMCAFAKPFLPCSVEDTTLRSSISGGTNVVDTTWRAQVVRAEEGSKVSVRLTVGIWYTDQDGKEQMASAQSDKFQTKKDTPLIYVHGRYCKASEKCQLIRVEATGVCDVVD